MGSQGDGIGCKFGKSLLYPDPWCMTQCQPRIESNLLGLELSHIDEIYVRGKGSLVY